MAGQCCCRQGPCELPFAYGASKSAFQLLLTPFHIIHVVSTLSLHNMVDTEEFKIKGAASAPERAEVCPGLCSINDGLMMHTTHCKDRPLLFSFAAKC